jgi:short-subunit dehydrogenase
VNGMRDQVSTMPKWLWQDAKSVAQIGYDALEANQPVVVTGTTNKTIAAIGKLLPDAIALRLMKSQVQKFRRAD